MMVFFQLHTNHNAFHIWIFFVHLLFHEFPNITSDFVIQKKCYIKDRSTVSYEESINNAIKDASNSKELILNYFDVANLKFNKAICLNSEFNVLGVSKLSQVRLEGSLYKANQLTPFISIVIGLKKLWELE